MFKGKLAIVRGGGDLATGIIYRLWRAGFKVLALEIEKPLVVRRTVSAAQAIFDGEYTIEDMPVKKINNINDLYWNKDVSIYVDPLGKSIRYLKPDVLVDAIMAKVNIGTRIDMAPLVIGVGPGFTAKVDVDYVVETKRGHTLGRLISSGSAIPNTGIPGMEMGYTIERILRSPSDGFVKALKDIGDYVLPGEIIAYVNGYPVYAEIKGVLRGLIHPSVNTSKNLKIGDIDPKNEKKYCFSITDKALAVGGGVLEALLIK